MIALLCVMAGAFVVAVVAAALGMLEYTRGCDDETGPCLRPCGPTCRHASSPPALPRARALRSHEHQHCAAKESTDG